MVSRKLRRIRLRSASGIFCVWRAKILSPDTILQHEQIQSVLRRFDENHVWVLPVVDKEKHYLGYISKSRIMTAYREQLVKISQ